MTKINPIQFNPKVKLILSDVDETIADVYRRATPAMIDELNTLLREGRVLFLVSGGGLKSIRERITNCIEPALRHKIIIAHCSGAEVWGFQKNGEINSTPYYGIYDTCLTEEQKQQWRNIISQTIERFHLTTIHPQPKEEFIKNSQGDCQTIMLADRGPQITFEFVNSTHLANEQKIALEQELDITIPLVHDTYDLRIPVYEYLKDTYEKASLPIEPRFGGTCALDSVIGGVNKTKAIEFILNHNEILQKLDIQKANICEYDEIEIWGDKFGQKKGGPDFEMCRAVSPEVRAIDFRKEDGREIPTGYNIQIWRGEKELHEGLLEYLASRHHLTFNQ